MKKHLTIIIFSAFVFTLILLSCTKSSFNERTITPPADTTIVTPGTDSTDTIVNSKKWIVSTFAGADSGKADGDSIYASFYGPGFITIDGQDNLFVSDVLNFNIRKITPQAHVTTYAGRDISTPDPVYGNFFGLAIDKQGSIFLTDGNLIRKISSPADVSVLAGNGLVEIKDGTGSEAHFSGVYNMTIDSDDNLYLADTDINGGYPSIRKVTPGGVVTTIAVQDNTGVPDYGGPQIYWNCAITIDKNGIIYRSSNENRVIKKITPDGNVTVLAGSANEGFKDGQGTAALFKSIVGMVTDTAGNLYITDALNAAIRKVTPEGLVTTIAGTGEQGYTDGEGSVAKFHNPVGITMSKKGVIYITDTWNNRIRKMEYK